MAVSLTTLRARVRERADMVGSAFIADDATGMDAWINEAHQKLHGMLVDALGEEYGAVGSQTYTTVSGTTNYALPADFFKLYTLDIDTNGLARAVPQFNRAERNSLRNANLGQYLLPSYRISGGNIQLLPNTSSGQELTLTYAKQATVLVAGADTVDYPNGWERFIVIDAAIQALLKEESSVTALSAERDRIVKEIEATKEARDLASPKRTVDVSHIDWGLDW